MGLQQRFEAYSKFFVYTNAAMPVTGAVNILMVLVLKYKGIIISEHFLIWGVLKIDLA